MTPKRLPSPARVALARMRTRHRLATAELELVELNGMAPVAGRFQGHDRRDLIGKRWRGRSASMAVGRDLRSLTGTVDVQVTCLWTGASVLPKQRSGHGGHGAAFGLACSKLSVESRRWPSFQASSAGGASSLHRPPLPVMP
jgi:hypothetical protein